MHVSQSKFLLCYALNLYHYRHIWCYMDSGSFSALLVESVLNQESLPGVWVAGLQERSQILDILFSYLLCPELLDLISLPDVIAVLESVNQ